MTSTAPWTRHDRGRPHVELVRLGCRVAEGLSSAGNRLREEEFSEQETHRYGYGLESQGRTREGEGGCGQCSPGQMHPLRGLILLMLGRS